MERAKRVIKFYPVLLPQGSELKDLESSQQEITFNEEYYEKLGRKNKSNFKRNIGKFYTELYSSIYGGEVNPEIKNAYEYYSNGHRKFHPDLTKISKESIIDTEVKSFGRRAGKCFINIRQLENYSQNLLKHLEEGYANSSVNYAFFRYGKNYLPPKLSLLSKEKLKKALSNQEEANTKDAVILPLNLLLFILTTERYSYNLKTFNQESSLSGVNEAKYWLLESGDISRLHKGLEYSLDYFAEKSHFQNSDMFMLDSLKLKKETSPERLYCGRYKVSPFEISRYTFKNKKELKKWNESFRENHEVILREIGINDLHKQEELARDTRNKRLLEENNEDLF